jgi:hypothetical protein
MEKLQTYYQNRLQDPTNTELENILLEIKLMKLNEEVKTNERQNLERHH